MGFHDHRGHVSETKRFCLGYGEGNKCDMCQLHQDWLEWNLLPNEERLAKQKEAVSVESDLCILNGRKYFKLRTCTLN